MLYCAKTKDWFEKRIGKTIYRDPIESDLDEAIAGNTTGFEVINTIHAQRLADKDAEYVEKGIYLNYRDQK